MSFILESESTFDGLFSQNGFQTVRDGAPIEIVFDNRPGRIYHSRVIAVQGIGQGQVAVGDTCPDGGARRRNRVFGGDLRSRRYES
jgi:multidrug resistance efflux pump